MPKDPWLKRKNIYSNTVPKAVKKPKAKWRILPILWMAFKRTCTFVGAIVLITSIFTSMMVSSVIEQEAHPTLPQSMVLVLDIEGTIGDLPKEVSLVDPLASRGAMMKGFVDAIYRAKDDPRVEGIYARLGMAQISVAHIYEIRQALSDFRKSGKFAYIYASAYGGGLGQYYLAAAFDEIWMQPMGLIAITGLNAEIPFLRDVLDKVGVEPQFMQRKEYKNAYESFTNNEMSKATRESMGALIGDMASVLSSEISKDRNISEKEFKALVDKGVLLSGEALEGKLVDVLDYEDKVLEKINAEVTGDAAVDADYIEFSVYAAQTDPNAQQDSLAQALQLNTQQSNVGAVGMPRVALVYAVGAIMDTGAKKAAGVDDGVAAADEISAALLGAAEDDTIDTVVLRVDSPGGSAIASETILRAVENVQANGKKVIVSMGPSAASGGYWISAYGDQIFALPFTMTGSIGVLGGKISTQQLWEKLGINWGRVSWGDNSGMWSMNTPFSKSEAERMSAMLDDIYDNFIQRVAKGREMSAEEVEDIARGRVWTGKRAVEVGLVDQLGGLNDALDYAAVLAGGNDRSDVDVVILPRPLTPLEQFIELLEGQITAGEAIRSYGGYLKDFSVLLQEWEMVKDQRNHSVYNPVSIR